MNVALVDDELIHIQRLHKLISDELLRSDAAARHRIDAFQSGQSFFDHWKPGDYEVIILDIFMKGITGVDVARYIRERDEEVNLVFCSTSNEFAAESYQVNAQYYLVKPATPGSITAMFNRLDMERMGRSQTVTLPDGHVLLLRNILYTEYNNHVITIALKGGEQYSLRTSHAQMEELLTPWGYFCSPSKGVLLNFYEVEQYADNRFFMSDQTIIYISRRKAKAVQAEYTKFRFQKQRRELKG